MNEQPEKIGQDASAATAVAEEQGLLFTDDVSPLPSDTGYRGPTACSGRCSGFRTGQGDTRSWNWAAYRPAWPMRSTPPGW